MKRGLLISNTNIVNNNDQQQEVLGALQDPRSCLHSGHAGWQNAVRASRLPPGVARKNSAEGTLLQRWPTTSNVEGLEIVSGEDWGLPAYIKNKPHYDKRVRRTEEPMIEEEEEQGNKNSTATRTADDETSTTAEDDIGMEVVVEEDQPIISTAEGPSHYSNNAFTGVPSFSMPTSMFFGSRRLALNSLYGKHMGETPVTNTVWKEAAAKRAGPKREPPSALEQEAMMEEEEVVRDRETCRDQRMLAMAT
jgi:hypothetical protein